jgi:hypothetical protein
MSAEDIKQALADMKSDKGLITKPNYVRTLSETQLLSFEQWHLEYLAGHPKINAANYLANLRVMIRARNG